MDSDQKKTCPVCAETIKAEAKVCPFCRESQKRYVHLLYYLGPIISGLTLIAVLVFGCIWLFPDEFRSEGRIFAPHREELVIERTSLERDQKKPEFWLNGYITNTGNYPWRVQELEVRFIEGDSNLADVCHAEVSEKFVLQPHEQQAFRVNLGRLVVTNSGLAMKVRVQIATDGNRPVKVD